jgi:hypothetical protein
MRDKHSTFVTTLQNRRRPSPMRPPLAVASAAAMPAPARGETSEAAAIVTPRSRQEGYEYPACEWYSRRFGMGPRAFTGELTLQYPVKNSHPALQERGVEQERIWEAQAAPSGMHFLNGDVLSKWLIMLPQVAVQTFELEPNFNDGEGVKELWVGRMWEFRRILWLQYCLRRPFDVNLPTATKQRLAKRFAEGSRAWRALRMVQRLTRGWFTRYRGYPRFLERLVGKNVRTIMVYMHGSGGLVYANPRFGRIAAGFGCVVFMPDHMSTDEGRARYLRPLHTADDDTGYWQNQVREHRVPRPLSAARRAIVPTSRCHATPQMSLAARHMATNRRSP